MRITLFLDWTTDTAQDCISWILAYTFWGSKKRIWRTLTTTFWSKWWWQMLFTGTDYTSLFVRILIRNLEAQICSKFGNFLRNLRGSKLWKIKKLWMLWSSILDVKKLHHLIKWISRLSIFCMEKNKRAVFSIIFSFQGQT